MTPDTSKLIVTFRNFANASENCNSAVQEVSFCAMKEKDRVDTPKHLISASESSKFPIIWPSVSPHSFLPNVPSQQNAVSHSLLFILQQLYVLLTNKALCNAIHCSVLLHNELHLNRLRFYLDCIFSTLYINTRCLWWAGIAQSVQRIATGWTVRGSHSGVDEIFRTRPDWP